MSTTIEETRARRARTAGWCTRRVAGGVLAVLGCAPLAPTFAACQVESFELPVKMVGSRAIATVGINGTSVPLTVDSGAFFSTLTDAAADQLKLVAKPNSALNVQGVTGRVDVGTTVVDKLQLLKGDIPRVEFIVGGNEPGAGTMGLLGRNILSFADTEYDLAHGAIRFLFPNSDCDGANMAYWAGSTPVTELDLETDHRTKLPAIRARVKLNGSGFIALFDTGATTAVSGRAARRAGIGDADLKPAGKLYGAGRGSLAFSTAVFDKFEIGGEAVLNNRLPVAEFTLRDADMLLGIDFFLSHRIYVSKKQERIFFTYSGGPVFALDKSDPAVTATAAKDEALANPEELTADRLARRGAASAARRDYASALADLDRACALEPATAALFAQRGGIREALKRPAEALEDYDKALALDGAQVDARLRRAALRIGAKDRDGAKADLAVVDDTLAPQAQARLVVSQLYLVLAEPAKALAQLNQWLPAHPSEVKRDSALNSRCWTRLLLGIETEQALDDCDGAVDSDPKNPVYLENRGWAYLRLHKEKKALADFEGSLEVRPGNAGSLYGRGIAKTRLGDAAGGDVDLAAARKAVPEIDRRLARVSGMAEAPQKP